MVPCGAEIPGSPTRRPVGYKCWEGVAPVGDFRVQDGLGPPMSLDPKGELAGIEYRN